MTGKHLQISALDGNGAKAAVRDCKDRQIIAVALIRMCVLGSRRGYAEETS